MVPFFFPSRGAAAQSVDRSHVPPVFFRAFSIISFFRYSAHWFGVWVVNSNVNAQLLYRSSDGVRMMLMGVRQPEVANQWGNHVRDGSPWPARERAPTALLEAAESHRADSSVGHASAVGSGACPKKNHADQSATLFGANTLSYVGGKPYAISPEFFFYKGAPLDAMSLQLMCGHTRGTWPAAGMGAMADVPRS